MKKLLWLGFAAFGAYEIYALKTSEHGDTISEKVWSFSHRPLIPFTLGMLAGHFIWQSQDVYDRIAKARICELEAKK